MKGRCLDRLTTEPKLFITCLRIKKTPQVGLEPTTPRLTAECSTIELLRNISESIRLGYLQNFIQMNCKPRIFSHTFRKWSSRIRNFVASARCVCFANSLRNKAFALLSSIFYFLRKRSPRIRVFDASSWCICFANELARKQVAPSASALAPLFLLVRFLRFWSSLRSISDSQLNTLLHLHLCPIYLVLSKGSYVLLDGISHLEGGFTLRCLQRLSRPDLATRRCLW